MVHHQTSTLIVVVLHHQEVIALHAIVNVRLAVAHLHMTNTMTEATHEDHHLVITHPHRQEETMMDMIVGLLPLPLAVMNLTLVEILTLGLEALLQLAVTVAMEVVLAANTVAMMIEDHTR